MKKKIAFFACGWSGDYIQELIGGIRDVCSHENADVFAFVNYSVWDEGSYKNVPELNILKLADMNEFDGVIMAGDSFNQQAEIDYLLGEIRKYNVPCVSVGREFEGIPYISTDNYAGMFSVVEHMITVHEAKDILYISGPVDNRESNERLDAFKDCVKKYSLYDADETENRIRYGNWSRGDIPSIIDIWYDEHNNKYPEVIICANDTMAITASSYLQGMDVKIPDDVKITGYDSIRNAWTQNPPIATVSHEWKSMGISAAEKMFQVMKGQKVAMRSKLEAKFLGGGSCGCHVFQNTENMSSERHLSNYAIEAIDVDSHFRHFHSAALKTNSEKSIHDYFSTILEMENFIEGKQFMMFLHPEFFDIRQNPDIMKSKVRDEYKVAVDIKDGKARPIRMLTRRECIFERAEETADTGFYIYVALYSETVVYGFAMLTGELNIASDNQYYIWARHMESSLEHARTNMLVVSLIDEIRRQAITDQLTDVYNRHGCEQIIYPKLIDWTEGGGTSVIMLVDVDHMKVINDKYGHAAGDLALKIVSSTLSKGLSDSFLVSRYGGDEFFVGGVLDDENEDVDKIVDNLEKLLEEEIASSKVEFELTMSIGYSKIKPKKNSDIQKAILKADENMYVKKQLHHGK